MDIARISTILEECAGAIDENRQPLEGCEIVELYLAAFVLNTSKVEEHATEMVELLREWPSESWGQKVPPLGEEIGFVMAGAVLGGQLRAFGLFVFGKVAGWWSILDPHTVLKMPYNDPTGLEMARRGMVTVMGYSPQTQT